MNCPVCGKKVCNLAAFCLSCGCPKEELEIAAKAEAEATIAKATRKRKKKETVEQETEDVTDESPKPKLCPVCGEEIAEAREICAECGRKEAEKERKKKKEKGKKRK
jgi:uncharacterized OB-fold protein